MMCLSLLSGRRRKKGVRKEPVIGGGFDGVFVYHPLTSLAAAAKESRTPLYMNGAASLISEASAFGGPVTLANPSCQTAKHPDFDNWEGTVDFWFKLVVPPATSNRTLWGIMYSTSETSGMDLVGRIDNDLKVGMSWRKSSSEHGSFRNSNPILLHQWNHLAFIVDRESEKIGVGVNGKLEWTSGLAVTNPNVNKIFCIRRNDGVQIGTPATGRYAELLVVDQRLYESGWSNYKIPSEPYGEGDPHWDKVVHLLGFDNQFTEEVPFDHYIERFGSGIASNYWNHNSPFDLGYGRGAFPGTSGTYAQDIAHERNDLLGQDFTIELMFQMRSDRAMRILSTGGGVGSWNSTNGIHTLLQVHENKVNFQIWSGTSGAISHSHPLELTTGTEYRIAVTLNAAMTQTGIAVNGSYQLYLHAAGARPASLPALALGTIPGENGHGTYVAHAYYDELRITKGVRRYHESYTPVRSFPRGPA